MNKQTNSLSLVTKGRQMMLFFQPISEVIK